MSILFLDNSRCCDRRRSVRRIGAGRHRIARIRVHRRGVLCAREDAAVLISLLSRGVMHMTTTFKVGDHVGWNSEAGHVSGKIIKVHKKDSDYKGYTHHASAEDPQYEIKSDKTDHVAMHKGSALHKI